MKGKKSYSDRKTLFYRMLGTYVLLTLVTGSIVCISSLLIFQHFHTESIHESIRQNITNNHLGAAERIDEIKSDIIGKIFMLQYGQVPQILNGVYMSGNYTSIKRLYDFLNQLSLEYNPYVSNIHLYYKETNILISSKYGLKFLDSHSEGIDTLWIDAMEEDNLRDRWIPAREIPFTTAPQSRGESVFSFATAYPVMPDSTESAVLVCIDFNEVYLRERLNRDGKGFNFILSGKREWLILRSDLLSESFSLGELDRDEGYYNTELMNEPYLVSYVRDPESGWILFNLDPARELYRTMNRISRIIVLIYVMTTLIGIWISYLQANRFYTPLKKLMPIIRSYDDEEGSERDGEFKRIGRVISRLGGDIHDLRETLDNNRTLLEAKFIGDLAHKKGMTEEEINDRLMFLDFMLDKSEYRFMKVAISYGNGRNVQASQAQLVKYRLINRIAQQNDELTTFIVTDYEENSILALINTEQNLEALKKKKLNSLQAIENVYSAEVFIRIYLTDPVSELWELSEAYEQIGEMARTLFYFPSRQLFTADMILPRTSLESFDSSLLVKFDQMLYGGSAEIFDGINHILKRILEPEYSLLEKQRVLILIMSRIMNYMKDLSINLEEYPNDNLYGIFDSFMDINAYCDWIRETIEAVYAQHSIILKNASHDTIGKVKSYIESHIDWDLSLRDVAEKVYLSPQYLSALFKKEEGVKFSAYLLQRKMEKAKSLLMDTDMNVEDVGARVGYQTSHYFIKKFKETTGLTPKQYRTRNIRMEPASKKHSPK